MKCEVCTQNIVLPFYCPYCGGQFCGAHRLPENHACPKIDFARAQRQQEVSVSQSYNSYRYTYSTGPQMPFRRKRQVLFSPKELKHITIAALLVIGIGFSIGLYGNYFGGFSFMWTWEMMAVFSIIITASFLVHEIAHKIIAQKDGLWAEFRLTTWGAVLTLVSVFLPFRMISPGAMMIAGSPNGKEIVKISLAGPITNIIFSTALFGVGFALFPSAYAYAMILFFAAYINSFIAVFNLIPLGILDGQKIFSWNKKIWALAFAASAALALIAYLYVFG